MSQCPECGAQQPGGHTCQDDFYQMLYWEAENPANGAVHHLTVLAYHLQHPSLYAPEGLQEAQHLLTEFVERGTTPEQIRQQNHERVDSGKRDWPIKARPGAQGTYTSPVTWTKTAADVVARGEPNYCDSVRAWAQSIHETFKARAE